MDEDEDEGSVKSQNDTGAKQRTLMRAGPYKERTGEGEMFSSGTRAAMWLIHH